MQKQIVLTIRVLAEDYNDDLETAEAAICEALENQEIMANITAERFEEVNNG